MPITEDWATPKDFATLFQYLWLRDLPIDLKSIGARRIDWTIHIGVIVRNIADLMGLVPRFEAGGRKDAVMRSVTGDEIGIEWEWEGIGGNELDKLKYHERMWVRKGYEHTGLKYGVFITYVHVDDVDKTVSQVVSRWNEARWSLLLILILYQKKALATRREFRNLQMYLIDVKGKVEKLRNAPAMPWNVECSRWQFLLANKNL